MLPVGEWEPVNAGESDTEVFRRADGAAYAKCADIDGISELRDERDRVAWLAGTGIPGAEVLDWIESAEGACLVTSAVRGVPGVDLPSGTHLTAVEPLAEVLRRLHDLDPADCPFERPLDDVVAQAADVVRRGAVNSDFLREEHRTEKPEDLLAQLQAELPYVEAADDQVVCHGDACLPNFLFDPESLEVTGLVDLGRLGIADRHADLALTTIQLHDEWNLNPTSFLKAYGLATPDQRRLNFYLLLDPLTWG